MKTCFKCGLTKSIDDFYKHSEMLDGRLNKCKECTKKDNIENRNKKIEYYREYDRKRANLPHRLDARINYYKTYKYKLSSSASKRLYVENNKTKRFAHNTINNAIRDGLIKKQPCEWCMSDKSQAHHFDYSKPLTVTWLCTTHHAVVHKIDREHKRRASVENQCRN